MKNESSQFLFETVKIGNSDFIRFSTPNEGLL